MTHRIRQRARLAGFSLVEVLVSIVVLCIGLLGMVGLQANSLQATREARLQSSGVALARDLAEMVRGNRAAGVLAASANPYIVNTSNPLAPTTANYCLSVGSSCVGTGANAAAIATATAAAIGNAEMTEWLARVDDALPGAKVVVCFDDSPYDGSGAPKWACTSTATSSTLVVKIGWSRANFNRSNNTNPTTGATDRASIPAVVLPLTAGTGL